jgi:hypothetical protein
MTKDDQINIIELINVLSFMIVFVSIVIKIHLSFTEDELTRFNLKL